MVTTPRDNHSNGARIMNATSLEQLRTANSAESSPLPPTVEEVMHGIATPQAAEAAAALPSTDTRMEQIRQLLLGDSLTTGEARLAALEQRQAAFEKQVQHHLDLLSQRLDALSRDVLADRRAAFDELSRAVQELGSRVRGI